jgi:hypothetical protein
MQIRVTPDAVAGSLVTVPIPEERWADLPPQIYRAYREVSPTLDPREVLIHPQDYYDGLLCERPDQRSAYVVDPPGPDGLVRVLGVAVVE